MFRLLLLLLILPALPVAAQTPVRYLISLPVRDAHHELEVWLILPADRPTAVVEVAMPRASPGRYALHEFAKNVYGVWALGGSTLETQRRVPVVRLDPYRWQVAGRAGENLLIRYTVFADRADGTYAALDDERAHLNLPAVLAYAPALAERPVRLRIGLPDNTTSESARRFDTSRWAVATQLARQPVDAGQPASEVEYSAPNLQYLYDSPVLIGRLTRRQWTQGGQQIETALLHRGTEAEADSLAARTQRITRAAEAVWGTLPRFDYGRYTFLADYLPTAVADGMEHRNSTMVSLPKPLSGDQLDHLGTISHEFFHCWNVERLRPADLEPFDFQRANMSSLLWLAEGFTLYYGDLLMRRAGLISDDAYLKDVARLINQSQLPGARRFSPIEMSQQAPFVDAARSVDPTNRLNTYVSYYTLGGATALALDLELRARDHSLDEVMRRLWETNGQFQSAEFAPQKPYTLADVQRGLAEVAGDSVFAGQFVRRYITGHELHDWSALLAPAGLTLQPANPGKPWLGASSIEFGPAGATLSGGTFSNGPLYAAGLDRGDRIERVGGRQIRSEKDFTKAVGRLKPSEMVTLLVSQRGLPARPVQLTVAADPAVKVVRAETVVGQPVTDGQKALRRRWLAGN